MNQELSEDLVIQFLDHQVDAIKMALNVLEAQLLLLLKKMPEHKEKDQWTGT